MNRQSCCAIVSALLCALSGCRLDHVSGDAITGQVIDGETSQPVAGAFVQVWWRGTLTSWFVDSSDVCLHEAVVATDDTGHFNVPAWTRPPTDPEKNAGEIQDVLVFRRIYKQGYDFSWQARPVRDVAALSFKSKKFVGSNEERVKELSDLWDKCDEKGMIPMLRAMLVESDGLPASATTHGARTLSGDIKEYICWLETNRSWRC